MGFWDWKCKEPTQSIRTLFNKGHTYSFIVYCLLFLIPYFRGVDATRDTVVGEAPTGPQGELWQLSGNWQLSSCDRQDPTKGRWTYVIYNDLKAARLEPVATHVSIIS